MRPWQITCSVRVVLVLVIVLICVVAPPLTAQQSQPAQMSFTLLLDDLDEWADFRETSIITIEVRNVYRPSESPRRIVLWDRLLKDSDEMEVTDLREDVGYPLSKAGDKWLRMESPEGLAYLKVAEFTWTNEGTITLKNNADLFASVLISVPSEPGSYEISVTVKNRNGTMEIVRVTQGYAEGKTINLRLTPPARFARLRAWLSSAEGLLGTAIAALAVILIGVLRDNIKIAFNKLLDLLGKYVGGKLAEKRFLKRYLENLIFNHKYLKLIGFNTAGLSRPLLEEVFVSLRIASNVAYESGNNGGSNDHSTISFKSAFQRYRCMVVLGGPGAGKTTTLSYTLLAFAKGTAKEQLGVDESLVPIYIPLRRLSDSNRPIIEEVTDRDIQILSSEILREYPKDYFEKKLRKGECLILLDGLDEVLDERTHRHLAERINSFVAAYPGNRFVATCRTAGWKDLLSGDFAVLSAQDFDREEIQRFVLGWHRAVITQSEYSRLQLDIPDKKKFEEAWEVHKEEFVRPAIDIQSRSLVNAIDSNNRILAIAVNPMLLSLISLVHFNRQFLPRGRTVLYSQCVDLLIDSWDRTRDILSPGRGVTATQKEAVLREIAFDFQTRGKGEDSRDNLEHLIGTIASRLGISTPVKDLLEDIETRSGLLTERSLDVFGFSHLTLQEYLVAKHIQLNQSYVGLLERNFDNQAWREVILLYTGLIDDATELIAGVASSDSVDRQILAGYCVGDAQHCGSEKAQRIIDRLLSELARKEDRADELVNVIAAIAADFQVEPVSVEERLSLRLIKTISNKDEQTIDRLHAITALGRARVTRTLPSLINLLEDDDEVIRNEAVTATIQFGDLALPAIDQFPKSQSINLSVNNVCRVLAGINTGSAARSLLKLYGSGELDHSISLLLAGMMSNPLVEAELLDLDTPDLPAALRYLQIDRSGWSYKDTKDGIWAVDTKLRRDIEDLISDSYRGIEVMGLDSISFKILFPAFLSFLQTWPKTWRKKAADDLSKDMQFFNTLGFDKDENNKLQFLVNQILTQSEIPLDLALQRISKTSQGDYSPRVPRGHKLWLLLANIWFILFFWLMIFSEAQMVRYLLDFYSFSRRQMRAESILAISADITLFIIYVAAVVIAKHKLKRPILSTKFFGIIFNPIGNFLKVLPYISRQTPTIKLILFLVVIIGLSPFSFMLYNLWASEGEFLRLYLLFPPYLFFLTEPLFLAPLTVYYWKYRVLIENPIFELMRLHPQGRQLMVEVT